MGLLEDFEEEEVKEVPEEKEVEEEQKRLGLQLVCEKSAKSITTGHETDFDVSIINDTGEDHKVELTVNLIYSTEKENRIPWNVKILGEKDFSSAEKTLKKEIQLDNGEEDRIPVVVQAPEGARYGEKLEVVIDATSKKDTLVSDSLTLIATARPTVVAVKTQIGQEKNVADYLFALSKSGEGNDLGIFSMLSPKPVRGYIFMEVMNPHRVEEAISSMRKAKDVVEGETSLEEIEHFLTPKLAVEGIAEGDIVELSAGPFKGEKARVTQINEDSDEITVELFEATVPIPVTVRGDHVRVLEKDK
ncbi:MAG: transcription elongation factor Spt5 [Candidatus Saliniplasma sp.]